MGKRSTVKGYWRAHGTTESQSSKLTGPSPAVVPVVLQCKGLDATADAGTGTGKYLPVGACVFRVDVIITSAISGGTAPILDIGLELATPDDNGLCDGLDYEAATSTQHAGALAGVLMGTILTEDAVEITYGDDGVGTNNTAGEIDIFVWYTFDDDGKRND